MRLITNIFEYCSREVPQWNTISVGAYHIREAGSTAAQEVAFAFAIAIAYLEAGVKAGLNIDDFAPRVSWIFNTHINFLEEVAKFRAARRLWAKIMKERFKAKDPRSWMLRFHTQTGGCTLTAQQPLNNLIRTTFQAMAAVLGGCQSLAVCSYDEALALPTEDSVRLSLRTQQIIAHESGADRYGGSAGRVVLHGDVDRRDRKAGRRIHRQDRPDRRGGRGHRKRIHPAGGSGELLPLPEGNRIRQSGFWWG